jgi:hypothetical protein
VGVVCGLAKGWRIGKNVLISKLLDLNEQVHWFHACDLRGGSVTGSFSVEQVAVLLVLGTEQTSTDVRLDGSGFTQIFGKLGTVIENKTASLRNHV